MQSSECRVKEIFADAKIRFNKDNRKARALRLFLFGFIDTEDIADLFFDILVVSQAVKGE